MYSESRGFYYEADLKGIADAQENVRKAKIDKQISEWQKQIKELEKAMKAETDAIDKQIKSLQEYEKQWSEVSSTLEKEINRQRALEILGKNWEQEILNERMGILETFTQQYVALQKAQKEAYLEARRAEQEAGTGTGGGNGNGGPKTKTGPDTDITNTDDNTDGHEEGSWTYNGKVYQYKEQAEAAQNLDAQKAYQAAYDREYENQKNKPIPDDAKKANAEEAARRAAKNYKNDHPVTKYKAKFKGTDSAEPGETLVGELGPEIVLHKNGTASVVNSPTLMDMEGGEKVFNAEETEKILKSKYVPLKNFNPNKFKLLNAFANGTRSAQQTMLAAQAVGLANGLNNGILATSNVGGQTINQTFNVSLPNITDASKANELFREFEQLQRRATQYFNK